MTKCQIIYIFDKKTLVSLGKIASTQLTQKSQRTESDYRN